jgi:hypothetical protein
MPDYRALHDLLELRAAQLSEVAAPRDENGSGITRHRQMDAVAWTKNAQVRHASPRSF